METLTFKCPCGKEATYHNPHMKNAFLVGDAVAKTGFFYVIRGSGENAWLCPDCLVKAKELAVQLEKIMGNDDFYFRTLLPKKPES